MKSKVLIVHRVAQGGHRYYLAAVERGEAPGRWWGDGAVILGLTGEVHGADLRQVLPRGNGRVPAFDLTFAAPKSVSVLHGLGSAPVAAAVRAAHDAGVDAALDFLQRGACAVRVAGVRHAADGLTVACFRHQVSRADDPHLHTHAVVANQAMGPDERWLALHSPLLYAERSAGAAVYHTVLRHSLTHSLGLTWEQPVRGRADCVEVPPPIRAAFSQRRAQIEGFDLTRRRYAERATRPERDGPLELDELEPGWVAKAAGLGWVVPPLSPGRPARHVRASEPTESLLPDTDRWSRAEVMVAIADRWPAGAPAGAVEAAAASQLRSAIEVRGPANGTARFTTPGAAARRSRVDQAVAALAPIADLEAHRRALSNQGRELVLVGHDAFAVALRCGARAADLWTAPAVIARLHGGDQVVVLGAGRLDSADVERVLDAARSRSVEVLTACYRPPEIARTPGAVATVSVERGDLTAAGSAAVAAATAIDDWCAARQRGEPAVLVAPRVEVAAVNQAARSALRQVGLVGDREFAGFSVGDVVRFDAPRPSIGIERHDVATVVAIDDRVHLARGERTFALRPAQLTSVELAHCVPPIPALAAGRGDVFVIGGVAPRHVDVTTHRYVTVDVEPVPPGPPWARRATGPQLDAGIEEARSATRPPPSLQGERRRLEERTTAARAWVTEAADRRQAARDPTSRRAWAAQLAAGRAELKALATEEPELRRREGERATATARDGPARAKAAAVLAQLVGQRELRDKALDVASDLGLDRGRDHRPELRRGHERGLDRAF